MSHDLTLPGTIPGLLRWCSPVAVPGYGCGVGVVVDRPSGRESWVRVLMQCEDDGPSPQERKRVFLDLTDATGRAHAAWWLAGRLAKITDTLAAWVVSNSFAPFAYRLHIASPDHPAGRTWLIPDVLSDLDPNDGARLPDGSRRVDAEALRRVVLHVAGVTP